MARPVIDVACGVLSDAAGRVLIAQRPDGKIAAGKWEFPGGKIEPGESAEQALARELFEELDVRVVRASFLARLRHDYADRSVWLDTWRVDAHSGAPRGREGQRLAWVSPARVPEYDLLPSCWRVLAALRLPRDYVFSPPSAPLDQWLPLLARLPAGALLRLRRPSLADAVYRIEAERLLPVCRQHGLALILDRDPTLVEALEADGWHADGAALSGLTARPLSHALWCCGSAHDTAQLQHARVTNLDAAVLGPVQSTPTHPGAVPLGWDGFASLVHAAGLPCYAIGGLGPATRASALAHGAQGISGISAYWSSSAGEG